MDFVLAMAEALQKGGPWVFLAVAMAVIKYLYQARERDHDLHAKEKQKLNDRLLDIVREQTTMITIANENHKQLIEAISHTGREE